MSDAQRAQYRLFDRVVSGSFHALMSFAVLAFALAFFEPATHRDMLFSAAWICLLASAGCAVWKLAIGGMQSRDELQRTDALG